MSAQDRKVKHNNYFEKYIRRLVSKGKTIPLCYFKRNLGNFVLVNKMYGSDNHKDNIINEDEHNYFGLQILPSFSEKGKIAMTFVQNYLLNGLKSALRDEVRTADTTHLLVANESDCQNLYTAQKNGENLYKEMVDYTLKEQTKLRNKKQKA